MKIAVLGTRGFPGVQGGVEAHCENLYPRLAKKGCEVVVFTRAQYVEPAIKEFKGVKLIPLTCPKNKFLEAFWHTFKGVLAANKLKPDILHIHAVGPSLLVPLAKKKGMKVIMTHHGPDYKRKKWNWLARLMLRMGEKAGCQRADAVICVSESVAEGLRKRFKRDVAFIPNGIIIPEISQSNEALKKYGLEKGKYILAVGRFVPEKGFHMLIEAFNKFQKDEGQRTRDGLKLVIAGRADHEDKYSKELKEKATENPNVILTGFLTGVPLSELYSHAGLFALPSYYEGLPIVLLEAMSYGLSCITSDIPANREVGLSEERLFKAGDIEALAEKIRNFIDKPLTEEEKRKQVDMVAQRYDWEKIAERTLEVYRRLEKG